MKGGRQMTLLAWFKILEWQITTNKFRFCDLRHKGTSGNHLTKSSGITSVILRCLMIVTTPCLCQRRLDTQLYLLQSGNVSPLLFSTQTMWFVRLSETSQNACHAPKGGLISEKGFCTNTIPQKIRKYIWVGLRAKEPSGEHEKTEVEVMHLWCFILW